MIRNFFALLVIVLFGVTACDAETRPDTETDALREAESTLDQLGAEVFLDGVFEESRWTASVGCQTPPFAPEQGDIGQAFVRSYSEGEIGGIARNQDALIADFERFWISQGEAVTPSSPNSPKGVVARVNGIGYDIVALEANTQLRAFVPCYR